MFLKHLNATFVCAPSLFESTRQLTLVKSKHNWRAPRNAKNLLVADNAPSIARQPKHVKNSCNVWEDADCMRLIVSKTLIKNKKHLIADHYLRRVALPIPLSKQNMERIKSQICNLNY